MVFDLNGDGAPGPNDFNDFFFQIFWDVVAPNNVIVSVQEFFVLVNFQFKFFTKILSQVGSDHYAYYF